MSIGEPLNPEQEVWDVVVIGTGMGGGTLGYALARAGRRVLFVEKGPSLLESREDTIRDRFPEEDFDIARLDDAALERYLSRGARNIDEVDNVTPRGVRPFRPFIGSGTGGSTALYGMVCERLFPADFAPRSIYGYGESTLPESWPISYDELRPWYEAAESLYRVRGTADPLRPHDNAAGLIPPPPMTAGNAELYTFFRSLGLHPYQLHMACEHRPECQTCQGYVCAQSCKNDAGSVCVEPAVYKLDASLLADCRVLRLEATRTAVQTAICERNGERLTLRGRVFVLAAGALFTPALLQASRSAEWPNGLANDNDLVGRNLMRHLIDIYAFRPQSGERVQGQVKELAINDLYYSAAGKYGTVQSLGPVPPFRFVMNHSRAGRKQLGLARPFIERFWEKRRPRLLSFASIMEDLPYADNRVEADDSAGSNGRQRLRLTYRVHKADFDRLRTFRREVRRIFRPYKPLPLASAGDNTAIAHVCGTCRFGTDPATSVLDATNRAHGLDNLYVADSSFFPSSGGINPSLTIAANALRVADCIDRAL